MPVNEKPVTTIRFWHSRIGTSGQSALNAKLALLPARQQHVYHSLRSTKRKRQYLHSRLLICSALSQHYPQPTTSWDIEEQMQGAPIIHNLPSPAYVSLSHSHNMACFALSPVRLGIDAELIKSGRNFREMAELFMSDQELQQMPLDEAELQHYFYRLWCAKEAMYKALPATKQSQTSLPSLSFHSLLDGKTRWQLIESALHGFQTAIVSERTSDKPTLIESNLSLDLP